MNPRSTDYNVDALTTAPSRRLIKVAMDPLLVGHVFRKKNNRPSQSQKIFKYFSIYCLSQVSTRKPISSQVIV